MPRRNSPGCAQALRLAAGHVVFKNSTAVASQIVQRRRAWAQVRACASHYVNGFPGQGSFFQSMPCTTQLASGLQAIKSHYQQAWFHLPRQRMILQGCCNKRCVSAGPGRALIQQGCYSPVQSRSQCGSDVVLLVQLPRYPIRFLAAGGKRWGTCPLAQGKPSSSDDLCQASNSSGTSLS